MAHDRDTVGSTQPESPAAGDERPDLTTFREPPERFELGDELGRGGMGRVIAAADVSLRRGVAIKQVLSAESTDLIRFEREVRITAQLEHPSIVPIYDVGIDAEDRPFYVMRRIDGMPLANRLDDTPAARLALLPNVLAVIDAAAFAHARKIIHRDIKPSNILLGAYGETWLIDWGLARRVDEAEEVDHAPNPATSMPGDQLTIAGHVYGTAAYMPPEQARGEPVDARADVYALGATLFHLLSGRGPFHGISAAQRIAQAIEGVAGPALPADTAPELRAIVDKAMAIDPKDRYADARELATDLRSYLAGQLVGAHRYTTRERFARFVRRHRFALAVVALSLLTIAIGAAISISRVLEERDQATAALDESIYRKNVALLEHASSTAEIDPARAIGLLRSLPRSPAYFDRARDIAAKAAAYGIPHGSGFHHTSISAIAFSPDGRSVATADTAGRVAVHTVATGVTRPLADVGGGVHFMVWAARGTKLVMPANRTGIAVIDVAAATVELYPVGGGLGGFALDDANDHVRFTDRDKTLWSLSVTTGEKRRLFEDVHAAIRRGDHWLLTSLKTGVRMVTGGRTVALSPTSSGLERALAIDPTGTRFAAVVGAIGSAAVVEWDAEGHELRRWQLPYGLGLTYSGTALYASTLDGGVYALGTSPYELFRAREKILEFQPIEDGVMAMTAEGHLWVVDRTGIRDHALRTAAPQMIALDAKHHQAAIGTASGEVRWWDYHAMLPATHRINAYFPCHIGTRSWLYFEEMTLTERDRRTQQTRKIAESVTFALPRCLGWVNDHALAYASPPQSVGLVDVTTGKIVNLRNADAFFVDRDRTMFLATGARLLELVGGELPPKLRYTAPKPIKVIRSSASWVVLLLEDDSLIRIDRATSETLAIRLPKLAGIEIAPDGAIWLAHERVLYRWTDLLVIYGVMDLPIDKFNVADNLPIIKLDDLTRWRARPTGGFARIEVGNPFEVMDTHVVIGKSGTQLDVSYIRTGEKRSYSMPAAVTNLTIGEDPHVLVVSLANNYLVELEDPVPDDPASGWSWIEQATNGRVDPDTDGMLWD